MKVAKVYIEDCIDEYAVYRLQDDLKSQKPYNAIDVYINSYGGYVTDGKTLLAILEMEKEQGIEVNTYGLAMVYSAATFPFMAGKKRVLYPFTDFLAHNPYGMFQGDAEALRKYAKELQDTENFIVDLYQKKTNKSSDEIKALMNKDTIITAQEALDFGFATEIKQVQNSNNIKHKNKKPINLIVNMSKQVTDLTLLQKTSIALNYTTKASAYVSNAKRLKISNMSATAEDGTALFVYSEDGTLVNKVVVIADANGEPSDQPAPDGKHTIVVESGEKYEIEVLDGIIISANELQEQEDKKEGEEPTMNEDNMKEIEDLKEAVNLLANEVKNMKDGLASLLETNEVLKNVKPANAQKNENENEKDYLPAHLKNVK